MSVDEAFALALQHHQAGQLPQAEALYRQILAAQPAHADALHFLGVLAHQCGHQELAITWIQQSLTVDSHNAAAFSNLGIALEDQGRMEEAIAAYRRAIALNNNYAEAYSNLGNALNSEHRLDEAIAACRRAIEIKPDYAEAFNNLGVSLAAKGSLEEAATAYRRAIETKANFAEAYNNLGNIYRRQEKREEAILEFQKAIAIRPEFAEAQVNLAHTYHGQGRLGEAIVAYRTAEALQPTIPETSLDLGIALYEDGQWEAATVAFGRALKLRPAFPEALNGLGNVQWLLGRLSDAESSIRQALALKPEYAEAWNNLGNVFRDQGDFEGALEAYRKAVATSPDHPEIQNNLGNVFRDNGDMVGAVEAYERAASISSNHPEILNNLGNALRESGLTDEALDAFAKAIALKPDFAKAISNRGNVFRDQGRVEEALSSFRRATELSPTLLEAHGNLAFIHLYSAESSVEARCGDRQRWLAALTTLGEEPPPKYFNTREADRRLRVGYVSADLREHVVGYNVRPLFKHHHRAEVEVFCYAGVLKADGLTAEFQEGADHWLKTVGLSDGALAEHIRQDDIDILVDLSQHTSGNRLAVFARQPAPVQVSFAGYPDSTGLPAIGHRLTDRFLESERDAAALFPGEQLHFLDSFWCYDAQGLDVAVNALPALHGKSVTFGCLNNFCKVNTSVLQLWAQVLRGLPSSRMVIFGPAGQHRQHALKTLAAAGVESARVEFVAQRARTEYLELYHRLDVILDTFPYNGHTTSLDALWMGVPVISLGGTEPVSRAGWSHMSNLGLPELAASTEEDYVRIATSLARDLPHLAELRASLRGRMERSVLMDAPHFARQIQDAYRQMWRQWCAGETAP